jgi:hypothetical protein
MKLKYEDEISAAAEQRTCAESVEKCGGAGVMWQRPHSRLHASDG